MRGNDKKRAGRGITGTQRGRREAKRQKRLLQDTRIYEEKSGAIAREKREGERERERGGKRERKRRRER